MVKQLALTVAVGALVVRASAWQLGSGNRIVYQDNCDFKGGDFGWVNAPSSSCGDYCLNAANCTAWAWEGSGGGTCWLKNVATGAITRPTGVNCGYVIDKFQPTATDNIASLWQLNNQVMYHDNCDLKGDDTYSIKAPSTECGTYCANDAGCTHWSWSDFNGGTCWTKNGWMAARTEIPGVKCGYVIGRFVPSIGVENGLSKQENFDMLNGLNRVRAKRGTGPVSVDDRLVKAIAANANELATRCAKDLSTYVPIEVETGGYTMNVRRGPKVAEFGPATVSDLIDTWLIRVIGSVVTKDQTNIGFAKSVDKCTNQTIWLVIPAHPV